NSRAALMTPARPSPAIKPAATEKPYMSKLAEKYFFHHQAVMEPKRMALLIVSYRIEHISPQRERKLTSHKRNPLPRPMRHRQTSSWGDSCGISRADRPGRSS